MRDEILETFAQRAGVAAAGRSASTDAKSNARYAFARTLDNTERDRRATLARFVRYRRSYDTLNNYYRTLRLADARRTSRPRRGSTSPTRAWS